MDKKSEALVPREDVTETMLECTCGGQDNTLTYSLFTTLTLNNLKVNLKGSIFEVQNIHNFTVCIHKQICRVVQAGK